LKINLKEKKNGIIRGGNKNEEGQQKKKKKKKKKDEKKDHGDFIVEPVQVHLESNGAVGRNVIPSRANFHRLADPPDEPDRRTSKTTIAALFHSLPINKQDFSAGLFNQPCGAHVRLALFF